MSKHTPWPLRIKVAPNGDVGIVTVTGDVVAECFAAIRFTDEDARAEARANAQLYAAATKLLAACEVMSAHYSASLDYQPAYVRVAREAIEAATGEPA